MKEIASGVPACAGKAEGIARVVHSVEEAGRIKAGDILVVPYTTPEFHHALMKAAAIVTSTGGQLSHSAIVARELGVPCVVGVEKAMEIIQDGKKILVDGTSGKIFGL